MLHGHPADNYGTCYTSYTSTSKTDPLAEYPPYNPVHKAPGSNYAGNFRYDITQWNPGPWDGSEHVDWIGFSTTIEPDMVDCNLFEGHIHEPTTGTYVHIEERNLNGATYCEGQVAGAMQWNPGTLGPGDTNSITVAIMFGCPPVDSAAAAPVRFWKTDDVNGCVEPYYEVGGLGNEEVATINYIIDYNMAEWSDPCVYILDDLPNEVNYISSDPCGYYDDVNHIVTWSLGALDTNQTGSVGLTVHVNYQAEPGGTITNNAYMIGQTFQKSASATTQVCCWAGDIIYVDANAPADGNGRSWATAYNDLQAAIEEVDRNKCLKCVWVKAGTYKPVEDINVPNWDDYSLELRDNVGIFGHFAGTESFLEDRNLADANNETILEGLISGTAYRVDDVLKATDINSGTIDGFTIRNAELKGIALNTANVTIFNCKVRDNGDGIYVTGNSELSIHNSTFFNNGSDGIKHSLDVTGNVELGIHNCTFFNNGSNGIQLPDSDYVTDNLQLTNCIFDGNDRCDHGLSANGDSVVSAVGCTFKNHDWQAICFDGDTLYLSHCNLSHSSPQQGTLYLGTNTETTIEDSFIGDTYGYGIHAWYPQSLTITTSCISNCNSRGIWSDGGNFAISESVISNNNADGIEVGGSSVNVLIDRCVIYENGYSGDYGIRTASLDASTQITNNWIFRNEHGGLYVGNPSAEHVIRNNTILNNGSFGVIRSTSGSAEYVNITNCILWNHSEEMRRCSATHSCISDCNYASGEGNICDDANEPSFYNEDNDDYHITAESPCKDAGDPNGNYPGQTDFDGEPRVYYDGVDMGADEYYWSPADFNLTGNVDFFDYALLAGAWNTSAGQADYNETCDLADNNAIDLQDLHLFCVDWLWEKAWGSGRWPMGCGFGGGFGGEMLMAEAFYTSAEGQATSDELMIPDAAQSFAAMPASLAAKVGKFYAINAFNTASALRAKAANQPQYSIDEIIEWLDEIWLYEDLADYITEAEYLEFRESIKATEE